MNNYWTNRYQEAVARVRKHNPDALRGGVITNQEIERLEKLADELEASATAARIAAERNSPWSLARSAGADLHQRASKARFDILERQDDLRKYKRELAILEMPEELLKEPVPVPSQAPWFSTVEDQEAFNAEFGQTVADLETHATTLKDYCWRWTHLTIEQQNRELILALAKRIEN